MLPTEQRLSNPPRDVVMNLQAKISMGCALIGVLITSGPLAYTAFHPLALDARLQHGKPATATVIDKYGLESQELMVEFHASGKLIDEKIAVSQHDYETTPLGAKTLVLYLPIDTSVCKIGTATPAATWSDFWYALRDFVSMFRSEEFVILAVFGAAPFLIGSDIRKQKRLLRVGHEAIGSIVQVGKPYKHNVRLTFRFDAEGERWSGANSVHIGLDRQFDVGQEIRVIYQPGNPKDNQVIDSFDSVALLDGTMIR